MWHRCIRCGEAFTRKSDLRRHLTRSQACPPLNSHTGPKRLLERLDAAQQKPFTCPHCGRRYSHATSLCRHTRACFGAFQTNAIAALSEKLDGITARLDQLTTAQTNATTNIGSIGSIGGISVVNNNSTNIDAHRTYNIRAWDPQNFDFEALSECDSLNSPMHRYFPARDPVEALLAFYMRRDPPENYSAYAVSDRPEDIRFFDGEKYARVENPQRLLDDGYQAMAEAFIKQVVTREAEFNDQYVVQGGQPEEFERQKGRLLAARDKADRIEVMMIKLSRMAPAIKKVIDDEQIPVEEADPSARA